MRKRNHKEKEKTLEQERKVLRETLDIVVQENSELKGALDEIKANVNENKLQLQEKINSITDRETAVTMLTNQIDSLKQKFNEIQQTRQKLQSFVNNNISEDNFLSKGSDTSMPNFSNRLRHKNIDDIKSKKEKESQIKKIKENIQKQKTFLENQQNIQNEINNLKRDVLFLKEKIEENKSNYIYYQYNYDIQNYFQKDDLNNLKNLLNNSNKAKDKLMYLVTDSGKVYRIKRREDLTKNNFINNLELSYIKKYDGNEVINAREKPVEKNGNEYPKKLTLYNNNFNNNIDNVIKYSINPNYNLNDSDSSFGEIDYLNNPADLKDDFRQNFSSRNKQKAKAVNSYVTDLLRGSFVL